MMVIVLVLMLAVRVVVDVVVFAAVAAVEVVVVGLVDKGLTSMLVFGLLPLLFSVCWVWWW